ncbi:MAG: molybdate ABC transporter substrate-binding protein [Chloroflexi bacterium]|nr:molybdate ABC transporter substrate-binding protein [Chloroflexota bacterium]
MTVRRTHRWLIWLVVWALAGVLLAACRGSATTPPAAPTAAQPAAASPPAATTPTAVPTTATTPAMPSPSATASAAVDPLSGQVTVFAAASLTDAFQEIAQQFQSQHPRVTFTFNFAGSPTLRTQLAQGAKADVFASADEPNMQGAIQDGTIAGQPQIFARNALVIIVPADNTADITGLKDLAKSGVKLVIEQKDVPAGNYARQVLANASKDPGYGSDFSTRVLANTVSEETNVKSVLSKVALGEADAGFVYRTDVTPDYRSKVKIINIPDQFNVIARYPIALVMNAPNAQAGQAFIDYVLSPAGQAVLQKWGFLPPQ